MEFLLIIAFLFVFSLIAAFLSSPRRRGAVGERRIRRRLARFEKKDGGKILSNVYIPKMSGGTTEIDLLLIHPKGLFVFESKNYSGWIFGNEAHQNWTQTLPKGWHGDVHKERFYNPIRQNASHIKHLMPHVRKRVPVWSVIVFSDECELKNITVRSPNVCVVHCCHVASIVKQVCSETETDFLTEADIDELYNTLLTYTDVSQEEKRHHAQQAFEAKQRL
ncbi:MAG: nuclease-related domain-containing protein [Alphaproteobacteria bacterium]|nr:nuclease-related domain-containing protein [Alphaproteobacteria bacterium]